MLRCDFCGVETDTVKRVAVDRDYDRLTVRHEKRYACRPCSEKKEKERQERLKAPAQKVGTPSRTEADKMIQAMEKLSKEDMIELLKMLS